MNSLRSRSVGSITYQNAPPPGARLDQRKFHAIVESAIVKAKSKWGGWVPRGLVVQFHSGRALGLAYRPGTGAQTGVRKVSFSQNLLMNYKPDTVQKTVLHELAHHYRDESFPRGKPHDPTFCAAMQKVDPSVTNLRACARENAAPDFGIGTTGKVKKYERGTVLVIQNGRTYVARNGSALTRPRRGMTMALAAEMAARGGRAMPVIGDRRTTLQTVFLEIIQRSPRRAFSRGLVELMEKHGWSKKARKNPADGWGASYASSGWVSCSGI